MADFCHRCVGADGIDSRDASDRPGFCPCYERLLQAIVPVGILRSVPNHASPQVRRQPAVRDPISPFVAPLAVNRFHHKPLRNHAFFCVPAKTENGFVGIIGGGSDAGFEHSLLLDWSSTVEDDALIGFTGWPTQQMMPVTTPRLHARPRPRLPVQRDCMNGTRGRVGKVADPLRGEGVGTFLPPRPKAAQAAMQPSNPRRNAGRLRLRPMKTRRLCRAASGFQGPM